MPKNKRFKYKRVKNLPNVTLSVREDDVRPPLAYPWNDPRFTDMKKILELGCGKGEHSLAFAAADPGKFCMGIDLKSHRLCVAAEKAIVKSLENVHFLRARIERIRDFFVEKSIHEIWLPFPDPYPKNRDVKFRLSAAPFLDAYSSILIPGGTVHLKTDSTLFFSYTKETIKKWGGRIIKASDNLQREDPLLNDMPQVVSAFEQTARSKGMTIKYLAFTLPQRCKSLRGSEPRRQG